MLRGSGQSWLWGTENVEQPHIGTNSPPSTNGIPSTDVKAPLSTVFTTTHTAATTAPIGVSTSFSENLISPAHDIVDTETIPTVSTTTHESLITSPAVSTSFSDVLAVEQVLGNAGTEIIQV